MQRGPPMMWRRILISSLNQNRNWNWKRRSQTMASHMPFDRGSL
jgi:hypothetical protein